MAELQKTDYSSKEILSKKGPVFATAIIAGTQAVKKTAELIPYCHSLSLESCKFDVDLNPIDLQNARTSAQYSHSISVWCTVCCEGKTGVEMEALVGVSHAALCIYDMLKGISHDMLITDIQLVQKSGGKSDIDQ